jgi:hypothetical protein
MNSQPSLSSSDSRLKDHGVLSFNQSIRHQLLEKRQEGFDVLLRVDEFDAKRHVLGGLNASLLGMHAVVGSEASLWTQNGRSGDASLEQQRNNLAA